MSTLPLKPVVDVYYNLGPISAVRKGFNLGAILGSSKVLFTTALMRCWNKDLLMALPRY